MNTKNFIVPTDFDMFSVSRFLWSTNAKAACCGMRPSWEKAVVWVHPKYIVDFVSWQLTEMKGFQQIIGVSLVNQSDCFGPGHYTMLLYVRIYYCMFYVLYYNIKHRCFVKYCCGLLIYTFHWTICVFYEHSTHLYAQFADTHTFPFQIKSILHKIKIYHRYILPYTIYVCGCVLVGMG